MAHTYVAHIWQYPPAPVGSYQNKVISTPRGAGVPGYVPLAPTPFPSILWSIIDSILVTLGQIQVCNFRDPNLVTFYFMYLILNKEHFTYHLQYKHSGTFANRKYEELSHSKNQKMCDPILETILKIQPHDSQSSCKNATPSNSTSH